MRKWLFPLLCMLAITMPLRSQEEAGYLELVSIENELKLMFDELYSEEIPGSKKHLYLAIDSIFDHALNIHGSYDYQWNKLQKIGKLESKDGKMKVFSWLYRSGGDQYHYTAYVQIRDRKHTKVYKLEPGEFDEPHSEDIRQKYDSWQPKIYYGMVTKTYKRKKFYTLFGMDFNENRSSVKSIEVLGIQRGKPVFRGNQFLANGKVKNRVILQYSPQVAASLRYNQELDMIVFDHLAPLHPIYYGNYQFYGPDGSYDGYHFEEGVWVLDEDVDARND